MKKKVLAVLLAAVTSLSLVACGAEKAPASTAPAASTETAASTEEQAEAGPDANGMQDGKFVETRHISVELYDRSVDGGTDAGDNAWTKWIQEQMLDRYNVEVEFVTVPRWTEGEELNNLLAAENAPDICYTYSYPTIQTYANMGGVLDLAPILDEYRPYVNNMFDWLTEDAIYQDKDPSTGTLWAIEGKRNEICRINTFVRKDWLDKLGLKAPTTKAEFEEMLKAFRDNADTLLGADASKMVPYSIGSDVGWRIATLIESFMDPDITDKELYVTGYDSRRLPMNGTKEATQLVNKWYNDGLIWKDFYLYKAGDATEDDMIKAGFVGAFTHNYDYPFRGGKDSINAVLAAQYGADAKFVAINPFEDKNGKYTKYNSGITGDRKVFFPATNDEVLASLLYLDFMSEAKTVEFLQAGEEGVIHTVADNGAWVIQAPDEAHHDWFQNSGKNIDMTINCNGLRLATPELTDLSLAYSYSDVDIEDVQGAIEAAKLDWKTPKVPTVRAIEAETEGTDLDNKRDQAFCNAVKASVADFDSVWTAGLNEWLQAGGQAIADERKIAWEETYGDAEMLP